MPKIIIRLLDTPEICINKVPVVFSLRKAEALFYYLAIEKSISRDMAALLLWDDCDEQTSRKNLRNALYCIKKCFSEFSLIYSNNNYISFCDTEDVYIDYDEFSKSNRAEVYKKEFLSGFYIKNSYNFDEWLNKKRQSVRESFLKILYSQMQDTPSNDVFKIEGYFYQYIKEDALDERVYLIMMNTYKENGLYYKGIKVYQDLNTLLSMELGVSPCPEAKDLINFFLKQLAADTSSSSYSDTVVEGRSKQLSMLHDELDKFLSGKSSVSILITGETGSGKTYLMERFIDSISLSSCIVLHTHCLQEERSISLQPLTAIMTQLCRYCSKYDIKINDRHMQSISSLFPMLSQTPAGKLTEDITISYGYRAARNSIIKLLSEVAQQFPIMLAIDSIEYMDRLSLEIFSMIIRARDPNIMFIGSCVDIKHDDGNIINSLIKLNLIKSIPLAPFSREELLSVIKEKLPSTFISDKNLDLIYNATKGNCFFLFTLLNNIANKNLDEALTMNVKDILLERLSNLPIKCRQLLDIMSLFPEKAALEIVESILSQDTFELLDSLDVLKHQNFINESTIDGEVYISFLYNKVQELVYSQLSLSKRRILHSRIASCIEKLPDKLDSKWDNLLIYHYERAGNGFKVLYYKLRQLETSARINFELYPVLNYKAFSDHESTNEFIKHFEELESCLNKLFRNPTYAKDALEMNARLQQAKGKYCILQGYYVQGLAAIHQSLECDSRINKTPLFQVHSLRVITFYAIQIWDTVLMKDTLAKTINIEKQFDLKSEYVIECRLQGLLYSMEGQYEDAMKYLNQSIYYIESTSIKEESYALNIAACYSYIGDVKRKQHQFEVSLEYYNKAINLCRTMGSPDNPIFFKNKGCALLALNKRSESIKAFEKANSLYNDSYIMMGRSITKGLLAIFKCEMGNTESSKELLLEANTSAKRLCSPLELGLLAIIKAKLLSKYHEVFCSILPGSPDMYLNKANEIFKGIPEGYDFNIDI